MVQLMANYNYQACVAFVRKQEGGNTDTRGDRGGRTGRGGITHTTYDSYRDKKGLPRQDVFLINDAEIAEIYWNGYWQPIRGDELPAGVDLSIFDFAINSGTAKANWEHRQATSAGFNATALLIHKICGDRLSFMHSLGSWARFGAGWGRRVAECEATALVMAGVPLEPALQAAIAKKGSKAPARKIAAGAVAAGGMHHYVADAAWVLAAVVGLLVVAAAITAFNNWRQGARVDALTAAIDKMKAEQAAAIAAKAAASVQADLKAKSIAAEQAALDCAKNAINHAMAAPPAPPQTSHTNK
jgi:lysozyme family protein